MNHARRHLRFQALAIFGVAIGLVPVLFASSITEGPALAGSFQGWTVALYIAATAGTLVAAVSFGRGEPMRLAWLLVSASYLALLPGRLYNGPKAAGLYAGVAQGIWSPTLSSVISGLLAVAGFLLLARAWRSSGLDQTNRDVRLGMRLGALAVAAALVGPGLVEECRKAVTGDVAAMGDILTDLLDGALFVVAVPVARAALGLGGGLVAWPWVLISGSLTAWLGYDAAEAFGGSAGLDAWTVRVVEEVFRSLGCGLAFAAGVAQRWVMSARD